MSRADLNSLRIYLENLKQKYIAPLEKELEMLESIAKGAQQAVSYASYTELISYLRTFSKDHYKVGQSIYIETVDVPDLWVSKVLDEFAPFVYVNDEQFVLELKENGYIDIGFFRLAQLETGKVNLTEYAKFTDYPIPSANGKAGVVKIDTYYGFNIGQAGSAGVLLPLWADNSDIDSKSARRFINPSNNDYATMKSLSDCKAVDKDGNSIWTETNKAKACETIGAYKKPTAQNGTYVCSWNNGKEEIIMLNNAPNLYTVPRYDGNKNIKTSEPRADDDCAPKEYVDNGFVAKQTGALILYGTDSKGNQTTWTLRNTNNTKNTIAGRDSNGNIQVGSAINETDCVNLKYFNENKGTKLYLHRISHSGGDDILIVNCHSMEYTTAEEVVANVFEGSSEEHLPINSYYMNEGDRVNIIKVTRDIPSTIIWLDVNSLNFATADFGDLSSDTVTALH